MKISKTLFVFLTSIFFGACNNPGAGGPITCSIPCVSSAPIADISTLSLSTGGTINVTYTLNGDITQVLSTRADIVGVPISLSIAALGTAATPPSSSTIVSTATIDAGGFGGQPLIETHYPQIVVFANGGFDSSLLSINPALSTTHYTYTESIGGVQQESQLTNYPVPKIEITP